MSYIRAIQRALQGNKMPQRSIISNLKSAKVKNLFSFPLPCSSPAPHVWPHRRPAPPSIQMSFILLSSVEALPGGYPVPTWHHYPLKYIDNTMESNRQGLFTFLIFTVHMSVNTCLLVISLLIEILTRAARLCVWTHQQCLFRGTIGRWCGWLLFYWSF